MLTKPNARLLLFTTTVVSGVLLVALWSQRAQILQLKQDYGRLTVQKQTLEQALNQIKLEMAHGATAVPARGLKPGVAAAATPLPPRAFESKQLVFGGAEVTPISGGLLATLQFKSTKTGPLSELFMAIEVPKASSGKILDLHPGGANATAHCSKRVLHDGKMAIFQCLPGDAQTIQLGVSVSGPVTLDLRGSCGLTPFQLDIAPTGTTVRSN